MKKLNAICAAILLTLTCCTVGPDYVAPAPTMPPAWTQAHGAKATNDAPVDAWWQELGDPQLTDLIVRAVTGSPSLAATMVRIQQSRAVLQQIGGQNYPDLDGSGGFSHSRESGSVSPFNVRDTNAWNIGLNVFWEIDLFGRIRRSVESANADLDVSIEDYHDVLTILQAEVARTYVELRTLQVRLQYLKQNIELQTSSRDLAQARFETEIAPELDVFQAESNLANTQAQLPGIRLQVTQTLHRLAVLLGEHAGALNAELAEAKPLPTLPESIVLGIPAELLRRRPDIRRSERQLAAQTALVGAATAQLYPQFSLSGAFGAVAFDIDRLFVNRSRAFNVTPGVSLNIFDSGRVRGAINEEEARTKIARLNYDNTVLLAVEETENAIAMLRRLREQRDALQRVVTASGRSAELAEELYKQGLRSFQNVLDAQRTLSSAQDALASSEGSVVASAITLYRALGGGWQPPAATGQETP